MLGGIGGWCDIVGAFTPSFKKERFCFCSSFHLSSLPSSFPPTLGGAAGRGFLAQASIPAVTMGYVGLFQICCLALHCLGSLFSVTP